MKFNKKFIREVKDQTHIVELIQEVGKVDLKKEGKVYKGLCCFHNETNPSLSVSGHYQSFKCFGCNLHGDCFEFVKLIKGIKFYEAVKFLADRACISLPEKQEPEEIFQYRDENGKVVNEVLRYPNKKFWQRRPNGKGEYIWSVADLPRKVPYRLPELIKAKKDDWVFIVEGEKHVDLLNSLDLVGTCNVGGALKWTEDLNPHFKNRKVIILPDNDGPGKKHAQDVAKNLYHFAEEIRIMELSGLPPKGDIIDWFDAGHTKEELTSLIEQTSTWKPDNNKEDEKTPENKERTQSQILVSLAEEANLFRTDDDKVYASIKINGHTENLPIRSKSFKSWLSYNFFKLKGKPPGEQAYQDAHGIIEAKGLYDSPLLQIFTRIAEIDEKIYLDLANEKWEAIEITKNGWEIISDPPVKFKRTKGMKKIPSPLKKGSIEDLRPFINISSNEDWILFVSWLISTFMPKGPYPILVIQGEQGSAKSFICRLSRSLIDPSLAPLRTLPKEERDLIIAANNSWIIAFDNLSSLSLWQSDALCRLSTGGGFSKRQNYTDEEETILNVMRPVILNGIDSVITRNDLADRSIIINLPPIPDEEREPENELMENISKGLPGFIGALCDAISCILKNLSQTKLSRYSRMADFERWIVAAEPSLPWEKGEFLKAYSKNRKDIVNLALDADCVAVAIKNLIQEEKEWEGTAAELLDKLEEDTSDKVKISKFWPKAPNILSSRARRAAPFLRSLDIDIQFDTRISGSGKRLISIRERQKKIVTPVTASQDHQQLIENKNKLFNESCDTPVTNYDSQIKRPSQKNLFKNNNMTEYDTCDGDFLFYSMDI